MYFYNYHVDPDLIVSIYEVGYEVGCREGNPDLLEETHKHECGTNEPYLDAAYRNKYPDEEVTVTHFVNCDGITIQTTDAGLDSLLRALEANDDIQWNKENN